MSTPDTMITDDLNEKPMAANSVDLKEGNRDSIPRVKSEPYPALWGPYAKKNFEAPEIGQAF